MRLTPDDESFDAFIFDLDGTLLTSVDAAERVWAAWAFGHGLDVAAFLPSIYGVTALHAMRSLALSGIDPAEEAAAIARGELDDVEGVAPIAGAGAFLASLPPHRWAVVSSSPREVAVRRLQAARLPLPQVLVAAADVTDGKPSPACFELAANRLGFDIRRCLVFEDSQAGIAAARASGAKLVIVNANCQGATDGLPSHTRDFQSLWVTAARCGRLRLACGHTGEVRY